MFKKVFTLFLFIVSYAFSWAQDNPVHFKMSTKKISDCEYDLIFQAEIDEPVDSGRDRTNQIHLSTADPVREMPEEGDAEER